MRNSLNRRETFAIAKTIFHFEAEESANIQLEDAFDFVDHDISTCFEKRDGELLIVTRHSIS